MSLFKIIGRMNPALRKIAMLFEEFQNLAKTNHINKITKKHQEIMKIKAPDNSPPFHDCVEMIFARVNNNKDEEINFARKIITNPNIEYLILQECFGTLNKYSLFEELESIYKTLANSIKNKPELFKNLLAMQFINRHFSAAQGNAMTVVRLENNDANIATAAFCLYLRAKYENNVAFNKLGLGFIEKVKQHTQGSVWLKIQLLDANQKYQEIIDFVKQEEIRNLYTPNDIVLRRAEMDAYTKLNNFAEVANCAERFLNEYNSDSIDEWRLVVKYHPNAKEIIEKHKDGIKRGPFLAEIDLAVKNNEDISPLLLQYSDKYCTKNCVFGDLKQYFNEKTLQKIQNISDKASNAFVTGKINFESTEGRLAAIEGEYHLLKYLETKDNKEFVLALDACQKFAEHPDCQFLYIRLCGMAKMVSAEAKAWHHLRLEGIQFFSLASTIVNDAIDNFNVSVIKSFCEFGNNYYTKSISNFATAINKAADNMSFFNIESMINFCNQIITHSMNSLYSSLIIIFKCFDNKVFKTDLEYLEKFAKIELFDKTDKTVLPVYFNSDTLTSALYPEIISKVNDFNVIARTILSLCLGNDYKTLVDHISAKNWEALVNYLKSEGKTLPTQCSMFELALIALSAHKLNKINEQKEALTKLLEESSNAIQINTEMLNKKLQDELAEENENINKSIELILNLLN